MKSRALPEASDVPPLTRQVLEEDGNLHPSCKHEEILESQGWSRPICTGQGIGVEIKRVEIETRPVGADGIAHEARV